MDKFTICKILYMSAIAQQSFNWSPVKWYYFAENDIKIFIEKKKKNRKKKRSN